MTDLLFYRSDGDAAVGHLADGKFVNTDTHNDFTHNWSQIVAVGDQLLFYRSDGDAAVGHIANGKFVNTDTHNDFTHNWSRIITISKEIKD